MKKRFLLFMYKLDSFLFKYKNIIDFVVNVVFALMSKYF